MDYTGTLPFSTMTEVSLRQHFFLSEKKTDILPVPNFNWLLRAWQKAGTISIETESSKWEKIN